MIPRIRVQLIAFLALSIVTLAFASIASARPGGGQSFSAPSRSSSFSSPSRSSSFGSGSSSRPSYSSPSTPSRSDSSLWSTSPSSPSSPTTYTPTYDPAADRALRVQACIGNCFMAPNIEHDALTACQTECEKNPPPPPQPPPVDNDSPRPRRNTPMTMFFLWPVGLLAVAGGTSWVFRLARQARDKEWASGIGTGTDGQNLDDDVLDAHKPVGTKYPSIEAAIGAMGAKDDAFSWILFEDFVYALYTEAHTLRATPRSSQLAAYFSTDALESLNALSKAPAKSIIVGSMTVDDVRVDEAEQRVIARIVFESNYSEGTQGFYAKETWVFSRSASAPARPLDRSRTIDCPNCGAPLDKIIAGKCGYCNASPGEGNLDWHVDAIENEERNERGPILIGTTEEVGTDFPTVVANDASARWADLIKKDEAVAWKTFLARVQTTFSAFHASWSSQDLRGVRPFLSDNLFETQKYWVAAYKEESLRNMTEDPHIATVQLSRVTTDAHFDAVTVRLYAACKDYTLNAQDKVVGGNRDRERQYSEYWTFIRGAGVRGAPRTEPVCPSCGAPSTEINMAGVCGSCSAKITNGSFDWVLSRIEQDEVYRIA